MREIKKVFLMVLEVICYLIALIFLTGLLVGIDTKDALLIVVTSIFIGLSLVYPIIRCIKRITRKKYAQAEKNTSVSTKISDPHTYSVPAEANSSPEKNEIQKDALPESNTIETKNVTDQHIPGKRNDFMTAFRKSALKDLLICLFFGWCGAHKFRQQKYFQFVIYLLSMGFFFIGWGFDTILFLVEFLAGKVIFKMNKPRNKTTPTRTLSPDEPLPVILGDTAVMMTAGEVCHYCEMVTHLTSKNVVVGYTGGHSGASVRVAKGLTIRTGGTRSAPIRDDVYTRTPGVLTITNKRIVFTSKKDSFDKKITSISAILPGRDGVELQFGSSQYVFLTNDQMYIHQLVSRILQTIEV